MFLNLTLAFGDTIPIIASGILSPALAYLPCPRALHEKCGLLPEDLIRSPDIGVRILQRDQVAKVVESSGLVAQMILWWGEVVRSLKIT
jgi:hypothetical protein